MIITGTVRLPIAPIAAKSTTVLGSDSTISATRLANCSVSLPFSAATRASGKPIPKATTIINNAEKIGRAPAVKTRLRRSLPTASVPSQCAPDGPWSLLIKSCSVTS